MNNYMSIFVDETKLTKLVENIHFRKNIDKYRQIVFVWSVWKHWRFFKIILSL